MAKKGMALLVAALIIWSAAAPMAGAANPFRDVPADHWAYDAIARLAEVGLVEGYPDGTFGGDRTFTRYEMAMVFARILARLEQVIDDRILAHIGHLQEQIDALKALREQDLAATREAIDQVRRELATQLGARIDLLEKEMAALRSQTAVSEELTQFLEEMDVQLTPQAEAALERLITERVREVVSQLPEHPEVVERLREVIRERGDGVTEREILHAVDEVIAEELERQAELEDALVAVQGDVDTLWQVVGSNTDHLGGSIRRMASEFREELDQLGVRIDDLADRVANLEEAVLVSRRDVEEARQTAEQALARTEALEKRTKFSGSVTVEADVRGFQGNATHERFGHVPGYLLDPRHSDRDNPADIDDEDLLFNRSRVRQVFNLMAETTLDSGLAVDAKLGLYNDSVLSIKRNWPDGDPEPADAEGLGVDSIEVGVTGEAVTAGLYHGLLNKDRIGDGFNKYVLDPDRFIEPDPVREDHRGMVLYGSTGNVSGTIITLNRDFHFNPSEDVDPADPRVRFDRGFDTQPGRRYALSGTVGLTHGWKLTGALVSHQDEDTHSLASAQLAGPLGDLRTSLIVAQDLKNQAGAVEVGVGAQLGVVDLDLAYAAVGENYGVTDPTDPDRPEYRSTFMGDDDVTPDQRWFSADAKTQLAGIDLRGRHHNIVDEDQFTRFDAGYTFDLRLPLRIDATVASWHKASGGTDGHTHVTVGWKEYALSPNLTWDLSYEILNGVEFDDEEDDWKKADTWAERKDKNTLDTRLTWRAVDNFTLYGGFKNVQENMKNGTENYVTAGVEYGVGDPSAARLILGYEIQTANVDYEDRTDRHTIKVGLIHRVFGKGNLRLEAKRIKGAGDDGATWNDSVDHVASLSLDYPVGDNLSLVVTGRYVDSDGYVRGRGTPDEQRENYSASQIKAGVTFSF